MAVSSSLWSFMGSKDKKKLTKAGFATPRGGGKNAYQNHVSRSNRVILPYERLDDVDLDAFKQGYVVRVLPEQCFAGAGELKELRDGVRIGENAFVLYRTRATLEAHPPLDEWEPRGLVQEGEQVSKRGAGVFDTGHYVLRLSSPKEEEGAPQGIFAPEYAVAEENVRSQAVLAYLIAKTIDAPYTAEQAQPIADALDDIDPRLLDAARLVTEGIADDDGIATCPLCLKQLRYGELHSMLDLAEAVGLANAGVQVEGATRSTIVNLFHQQPLLYARELHHRPHLVAWGHAICNTLLGQRRCVPLAEMKESGVELRRDDGSPYAWSAVDDSMLRSEDGGVWVRLIARGVSHAPISEDLDETVILGEDEEED